MRKFLIRTDFILAVVCVVLLAGVLVVGHRLWWFTPASSQRQTVHSFFSDLTSGDTAAAYKLTSPIFQKDNGYPAFQQQMAGFKGQDIAVSYQKYLSKDNRVAVLGELNDKKLKQAYTFGIDVASVSGKNNVDTFTLIPVTN